MKKRIALVLMVLMVLMVLCSCEDNSGAAKDMRQTIDNANRLQTNQPTPSDIEYSLERYNLIRRAYWVNGQREKAMSLPCEIADIPLGYVVLITDNGSVVGRFCVHGKVSSLNSYLTPDSEAYEVVGGNDNYSNTTTSRDNEWLADVDGSYGSNDNGIFFFTPDGKYIEWNGGYLYSDIPFIVDNPVVTYEEAANNG